MLKEHSAGVPSKAFSSDWSVIGGSLQVLIFKGCHQKIFCKKQVGVIARCRMQYYGKYSPSFSYFEKEKRGEYLRIFH